MKRILASLVATFAFAVAIVALAVVANPALAQGAPSGLPTAPGAHKAVDGGLSQAPASLPGPGESPLEPYLVTWLLPVAGIVVAIAFVMVDKRLRVYGASAASRSGARVVTKRA